MKNNKIIFGLLTIIFPMGAHVAYVKNSVEYPFIVDFLVPQAITLEVKAGSPNNPSSDERDIGGWCTGAVRVTIKKPNGSYGGSVSISTLPYGIGVAATCSSFDVIITKTPSNDVKVAVSSKSSIVEDKEVTYPLADLLQQTTENSIITNNTNMRILLLNAPSLGTGATDGVAVDPGATIPFYLNAGSSGEELIIKGTGAGTVSFGNDYAKYKTTLIKSKKILWFLPYDKNGSFIRKGFNAKGEFVIDPLERLDIVTPEREWEIKLKVAEPVE